MLLAPPAAHAPFTPAKRHLSRFQNVTALRTPAFNCSSPKVHAKTIAKAFINDARLILETLVDS